MADDFNPDWSLLEATQASLREHMRMARVLLTQLQDLRNAAAKVDAHAAECLRRIRVTLGVDASESQQQENNDGV